MSNLGTKCQRQLWYQINKPELAEPLTPETKFKFLFGDILESLLLFLAKEAGHNVSGEQTKLDLHGIKGSRDAVIDGVLVDVKSASSRSFSKFNDHLNSASDDFGYLTQLGAYLEASNGDGAVREKDIAAFLVVDKQLGKIVLDVHSPERQDWQRRISDLRRVIEGANPPERFYTDVADGKSGNRKLGTACSYCPFKFPCWGNNLHVYFYSTGPRFLTVVAREPRVDKGGEQSQDDTNSDPN